MLVYNLRLEIQGKSFVQVLLQDVSITQTQNVQSFSQSNRYCCYYNFKWFIVLAFLCHHKIKKFIKINNFVKKFGMFFPKF